jgi:type I restriction enzyme S subunit
MVGTMAKIDDSVKKKVPELRFKGFTDDWEQRKFDECFNFPVSTNSLSRALLNYDEGDIKSVHYGDILIKYPAILNIKNDKIPYITGGKLEKYKSSLLENGDLIFADAAEDETVGKAVEVNGLTEENLVAGLHTIVARPKDKKAEFFLGYYINSNTYHRQLLRLIQGSKVSSISKGNLQKTLVSFPKDFEEQQKIGAFFKKIDDTIALHQRKLDLLKEQKKGYLQKMFPKNGAKVPELRFAGFADDWEERKLGEFSDVRDGTHASPKYVSQGHPMVTSKNLTHSGLDMTDVSFLTDEDFNEINKRSKVSIGDILFGMIGTIGNPVIVDRDDFAIKNVALIKEKTSTPITNKWLLQYLKSPSFNRFIQKENAGGTQKFIALGLIRDMKLRVPELDEQQKIGSFFKQLDNTIALHQRKLDLLKEQKKGFLQKMFV